MDERNSGFPPNPYGDENVECTTQAPAVKDLPADHAPVYGDDFSGIITLYADQPVAGFEVSRGGFAGVNSQAYRNTPLGWVCGPN